MALGVVLASSGLLGKALVRSLFLAFPLAFLFGATRAPSAVGYSLLSRVGGSRAGKFGFYLTLENLGFVAGSFLGGIIYNHSAGVLLFIASGSLIVIGVLSLLGIRTSEETASKDAVDQLHVS